MRIKLIAVAIVFLSACTSPDIDTNSSTEFDTGLFSERVDHEADLSWCPMLAGTMGLPDPVQTDFSDNLFAQLPYVTAENPPSNLPNKVFLRSDTQTYNRKYQFVLEGGSVWFKSNIEDEAWRKVPTPSCLDGTIIGISADDDELIAIRKNGDIYGLDNILKSPLLFNWTSRWGPPVWLGSGYHIPESYQSWSWSVISNGEDENWTDPAGNLHRIGDGKVSHIWVLSEDGQRFIYIDPWLPKDESYEACGPLRGAFKAINLNSSGSSLITINRYGDIYTRHYDFDLAGADPLFFDYSFEDQRNVSNPAIQLPTFEWVQQPKVPGEITDNISIHKVGKNMIYRILRVEGVDSEGNTGYWEKDIGDMEVSAWQFYSTGAPLIGGLLANSPEDTSDKDVGDIEDVYFAKNLVSIGGLDASSDVTNEQNWVAEMVDFNFYCSPTTLRIHTGPNETMDLVLHVLDTIRQFPRSRGLDEDPRAFRGNIEVPDILLNDADNLTDRQREFLDHYLGGRRFTDVNMSGIAQKISVEIDRQNEWVFTTD